MGAIWLRQHFHTVLWESLERELWISDTSLGRGFCFVFLLLFCAFACAFRCVRVQDLPLLTNKWCQWEGRVATGMLSAHAVVKRSWGIILLCVHVYHTPVVFSPVITAADKFSPEASYRQKKGFIFDRVCKYNISVCDGIYMSLKATS